MFAVAGATTSASAQRARSTCTSPAYDGSHRSITGGRPSRPVNVTGPWSLASVVVIATRTSAPRETSSRAR